ncbi:Uncharacterised protein [Dorea longicatena]|nr:Uncharacterised protein [Dorea longicatena]
MISDRIYDSRFLGSRDILIPVTAVFGCGFDFREVDGLVGIFDVRMECIILTVNNDFMDAGGYAHEQLQ